MDKKIKILIGIGVILFVCLVTWVIRTTPKAPPPQEKIEPPTVMEYDKNTITEEKNGVKVWEISADKIKMDSVTQMAEFEKVEGKFYQEDGKVLSMTGNSGVYNQQTKDVHVEGDVTVIDGDGAKLTSKNLDWKSEDETITATEDVKIFREDMRAFGDFATSNDGFRHFVMKGRVRILKGVKDDDYAKELEEKKAAAQNSENEKNNSANSAEQNKE
ncbi:MAG: LPS export ABC transporter periplasmic protein LptC [Selenomonadaceae bacterium]|nr:LPS export ABC transporter periplasmic protein LptC [Selenomonadaceae bacterium]